jgi:hypothetical protein
MIWSVSAHKGHGALSGKGEGKTFATREEAESYFEDVLRQGVPDGAGHLDVNLQWRVDRHSPVNVARSTLLTRKSDGTVTRLETPGITPA